jgi:hypothetical protein
MSIKIKSDLRKLEDRFGGIIKETFSTDRMSTYAMFLSELIKKRTRLGYGVKKDGGEKSPLKALSKGYKKTRKDSGKLSSLTSVNKSNLTFTGQLLNSLFGVGTSIGKGEVYIKEERNDGVQNSDIVDGQEKKQGRSFFYVSKLEKQQLANTARKDLLEYIKKNFN